MSNTLIWLLCAENIALIVNDSIYPYIRDSLETLYIRDLENEGYRVMVFLWPSQGQPSDLRNFLWNLYRNVNLEGAVLIGKLPYA
ncbi:MAG: hypothetical protein ABIN54_00005, partial [candidate division WOR-3 bacterium]